MKQRARKLMGTVAILAFCIFYALLIMAFAHSRVVEWSRVAQLAFYIIFGMGWIVPILPLIKWMEKKDLPSVHGK